MKHIHLMGICGTAMASLAGLLKEKGYQVTGSDSNPYPPMSTQIESLGIQIQKPYSKNNLDPKPDLVVVGNVISKSNEEAQEMVRLSIPFTSLPKAIGEWFIDGKESIVIAGTHGKTTTTSMMSWLADQNGFDPGFLIGGIPKNFAKSFHGGKGKYFIIEGDEYDTAYFDKVPKFIHYHPLHVVLTSIEFDHADIYKDLEDVKSAFAQLLVRIPKDGHLIYNGEDKNINDLLKEMNSKMKGPHVLSYGFKDTDYTAKILKQDESGILFEVYFKGEKLDQFQLSMVGSYNVLNATATIAMSHQLKWSTEKTKKALTQFLGVKRRQEIRGDIDGVLVIEDFAHHPTAVRETVKAVHDKYPGRRVFSIFEPRSATSRRKVFQQDYLKAFEGSYQVYIAEAFDQSRIAEDDRFSSQELVEGLAKLSQKAACLPNADSIVKALMEQTQPNDIVLIMSNGGFDGIYEKLLSNLKTRSEQRGK